MAAERKYIKIEEEPDIADVAHDLISDRVPVVLRMAGKDIAVINPLPLRKKGQSSKSSDEAIAKFRATSGRWKGLIDADEFLRANDESRGLSPRTPVDL